ncbi:pyruvate kinase [Desulfarculus baarsii DSM 2075]|uniref:Pyruvate kinase n=1 Tax=Desulfarculus baarsii (strain ATCC 33931 / DSM 2075 / LMG 7858 / VKM B-1802 / 2st14) TaxID=644282 RepID=E1QGS0_DESB2|nr:pyruvate kinase [Desulfarculus baarsii]ADK84763.1 pyruvate kinase [Desulfarculus baarsii DSM 2075]
MNSLRDCRKTKIVATIGPVTASPAMIGHLVDAGLDVARLNFSHGDHDGHRQVISAVRRAAAAAGRPVGVLMDLAGPKIRLGVLPLERRLRTGQAVTLVQGESAEGEAIPVNYPHLLEDVEIGGRILMADGLVELVVTGKKDGQLLCSVITGGEVSSRKGVNLPTSVLRIPAFTEKDRADLEMGLAEDVDFVALSFVRHEQDLAPVREILARREQPPLLIAKIEKPQAVERLDEILEAVDGVMVARGDLGVEMPLEEVPIVQKRIIDHARRAGKLVITATQMLRSMMTSPRPTRAEATDVANAVFDGTDAVMLSDETAAGNYPLDSVKVMDRICRAAERELDTAHYLRQELSSLLPATEAALSRAAVYLARDLNAAGIVASTASGGTARLIARFRPRQPVIGLTPHQHTLRQLTMSWGVIPAEVAPFGSIEEMLAATARWCKEHGLADKGDKLIVTAGLPLQVRGSTNMAKVMEL